MDNRLQATFMPRQVPGANDAYVRPKGPPNFLMGIALILLLLTGAAWGGLHFFKGHTVKQNDAMKAQIQEAIENFDPELTRELTVLKARLDAGKTLINGHVSFSRFLNLLAANTVQTIQFNSLMYTQDEAGQITLDMKGRSRSYNAIAFQSDVFSRVPEIVTPVFSGLVLDDKGVISFNVKAGIDPKAVSYAKQYEDVKPAVVVPVANPATTSPATSTPSTSTTTNPRP